MFVFCSNVQHCEWRCNQILLQKGLELHSMPPLLQLQIVPLAKTQRTLRTWPLFPFPAGRVGADTIGLDPLPQCVAVLAHPLSPAHQSGGSVCAGADSSPGHHILLAILQSPHLDGHMHSSHQTHPVTEGSVQCVTAGVEVYSLQPTDPQSATGQKVQKPSCTLRQYQLIP